MSKDAAHKRWWQTFEVIFGGHLLVAITLQLAAPLAFPQSVPTPAVVPGGATLIVVGAVFVVLARREFALHSQPTDPGHLTSKLVTTGVFSLSRNPLYLGGVCILVGIALAANLPWMLVLLLPALIACHYVLIVPEERFLAAKFGDHYHMYAASVHRWIGHKRISR